MLPYKPPHAAKEIPVIDLTESYSDDLEKRKKLLGKFTKLVVTLGFFM